MPAKLNEKISKEARLACEKWREGFKYNIDLFHENQIFIMGQQWTKDQEDDMMKTYKKIAMTANHLGAMRNSLLGEQQQNTPQIEVIPITNCKQEVIQIRQDVTKEIMFSSDSKTVYQVVAGQSMFSFSAYCIDTDYSNEESFNQDIKYHYFRDPTKTYFDLSAEHINKIDGEFCGYYTRMSRSKFKQIYGEDVEEKILKTSQITQSKEEIALAVQPTGDGSDDPFCWADDDSITIIHHYKRTYINDMLYKMSNGESLNQEELEEVIEKSKEINQRKKFESLGMQYQGIQQQEYEPNEYDEESVSDESGNEEEKSGNEFPDYEIMTLWMDDEPVRIEQKKEYKRCKIMHYVIAGDYVLDESEFASNKWLPIVFVDYDSYYDKSGKQICQSFFGDAKDTQRYINYIRTLSAHILKISRYDQFMGSKKNVASLDTRRNWSDPSSIQGMIAYDESPSGAKPEQLRPPELSESLFTQYQLAVDDLYRLTGLYPARMGNSTDEASGKAQRERTKQGSYATNVFKNSIDRAIAAGGMIINSMIPKVYDVERVMSIMTSDGRRNVTINSDDGYGNIENDIRKGSYDVVLIAGPSYEGQKQDALESLQSVLQADPTSFPLIADLYADNLPLGNTTEIKNRLKTRVPPEIIEAGKTGQMPQQHGPNPEQQAMELQQQEMQQAMMFKSKELELKEQEIKLKQQEILMEAQFKLQELETERLKTAGELQEQELRYAAESERTESNAQIAHADNLVKILTHKMKENRQGDVR